MKKEKVTNILIISICMGIYVLNYFFKKQDISYSYPFIRNHLNDVLASLIVLSYGSFLFNFLNMHSIHDARRIFLICCFCSFVWEYAAKFLNPKSTSDWWDVACNFTGGLLYWLIVHFAFDRKSKRV